MRSVAALTPRMVRVTLAGGGLDDFPIEHPGEIVTLLWPGPGGEIPLPVEGWRFPAGVEEPHARNYTVRAHDAAAGTLDVDFVLHGDHGVASAWAARARPGDRLGYAGPRPHWAAGDDDGCAWTLLVADETGLPALAAIAATLPAFHRAIAVVEVADAQERQRLSCPGRLDVHWVDRDGAPAGETLALADALRALPLPDGRGRAWGAGESGVMRVVRDHLRDERGFPRADLHVLGYWKHDRTKEWTR